MTSVLYRELLNLMSEGLASETVRLWGTTYTAHRANGEIIDYICKSSEDAKSSSYVGRLLSTRISQSLYMTSLAIQRNIRIIEPLLDEVEKKYLEEALRPFKKTVLHISKFTDDKKEWITVAFSSKLEGCERMRFPSFEHHRMYKNMAVGRQYTPHELGLWEDKNK